MMRDALHTIDISASRLLMTVVMLHVVGCPSIPAGNDAVAPLCDAEQICRDLNTTNEAVDGLIFLEGTMAFCGRLDDGTLDRSELCAFCDVETGGASGSSADEVTFCQDPVEQIVAGELDYLAKLDEVSAGVVDGQCSDTASFRSAVEGNCDDQTAFLLLERFSGEETLRTAHYFDLKTGALLGIVFESSFSTPPCCGRYLWPNDLNCAEPVVMSAICGSSAQPGDSIAVP